MLWMSLMRAHKGSCSVAERNPPRKGRDRSCRALSPGRLIGRTRFRRLKAHNQRTLWRPCQACQGKLRPIRHRGVGPRRAKRPPKGMNVREASRVWYHDGPWAHRRRSRPIVILEEGNRGGGYRLIPGLGRSLGLRYTGECRSLGCRLNRFDLE